MKINEIFDKLKSNGYKITEQRKAILEVLNSNIDSLISVENLYKKSKEIYYKTNMSTIYRNLEVLENLRIVCKIVPDNGISLYKLMCSENHHYHIICKKCGKTEVIDFSPIDSLTRISKDKKFVITDYKLELYGYCLECQASEDS